MNAKAFAIAILTFTAPITAAAQETCEFLPENDSSCVQFVGCVNEGETMHRHMVIRWPLGQRRRPAQLCGRRIRQNQLLCPRRWGRASHHRRRHHRTRQPPALVGQFRPIRILQKPLPRCTRTRANLSMRHRLDAPAHRISEKTCGHHRITNGAI